MNIVEFLTEDHEALREERLEIKETLSEEVVRKKMGRYIAHCELHETIEDKFLFPTLMPNLPNKNKPQAKFVASFQKEHERIWNLLVRLHEDIKRKNISSLQEDFQKFFSFVESHVDREEGGLFPVARRLLDSQTLEELGGKAGRYHQRYLAAVAGRKE